MKYLKKYNTFLNESNSESKIDEILSFQKSIHTNKYHAYSKDELCNMSDEELDNIMLDLKAVVASIGKEDSNFIQSPYNRNLPSEIASGKIEYGL